VSGDPAAPPAAASPADELDLLTPVLTEADDLVGFREPWNPNTTAVAAFLCGPIFGPLLLAWNFRRLGEGRRALACAGVFAAWWVLLALGVALLVRAGDLRAGGEAEDAPLWFGIVSVASFVLLIVGAARLQRRRYRLYVGAGREPGRVLPYGIAAFVLHRGLRAAFASLPFGFFGGGSS
jgi:hypothetical protein